MEKFFFMVNATKNIVQHKSYSLFIIIFQTVAEEYINKLNLAATKIQNWFLRHRTRRLAAEAAVQRLLQQKKAEREDILKMSVAAAVDDTHKTQDKKRFKEEKARQARQEAIQVYLLHSLVFCFFLIILCIMGNP